MLYFAYGMNTNRAGMAHRCPAAVALGAATLLGHRFRFAGPADVQVDRRHNVEGVLWDITEQCLASLDTLEGYPWFYQRKLAKVKHQDLVVSAMVYFMQPGNRNDAPGSGYWQCLVQGYQDFGVPVAQLNKALPKNHGFAWSQFG